MSTSSKPKSRPPAHQNSYAFRHNKNSPLSKKISAVTTGGLCTRCADKIEWRKKYRKYKPLSAPRKCNTCQAKKIKAAYHSICVECAKQAKVCQGCGEKRAVKEGEPTTAEMAQESDAVNGVVEGLREREKRTVIRRVARGESAIDVLSEYVDVAGQSDEEDADAGSTDPHHKQSR